MDHSTTGLENNDIAIIGMAGIFPDAVDLNAFWKNIVYGKNAVREVDACRWRTADMFDADPRQSDKVYSKWGGFLNDVLFEPTRYGIPPVSLKYIEAVQLLALEIVRYAIEDTGIRLSDFPKRKTAVIFGAGGMHDQCIDYIFRTMLMHYLPRVSGHPERAIPQLMNVLKKHLPEWTEDSFPGILGNIISGRVANRFDMMGSNYTVDAACASSLAALDVAMAKLRSGQADAAIVGAVDLTDNIVGFTAFSKTLVLSPRGKSCPFDDSADGIVISEGAAALVLKRLGDAQKSGDLIRAVIKGIGSSSDGRNRSLTAPHPQGQVMALERAYEDAGVDPESVALIEAHGTGTVAGDKSEVESLHLVFGKKPRHNLKCALGSVKSNIGHTKIAAGLAGLIKGVLALENKTIPPTIGIEKPNHRINFDNSPFYLSTEPRPWFKPQNDEPRRCGVSAFGFGGTNFHAVLEAYPDQKDKHPKSILRDAQVFIFSALDRAALTARLTLFLERMAYPAHIDCTALAHVLYAEYRKETTMPLCRLCVVADSGDELKERLTRALGELLSNELPDSSKGIYYGRGESVAGHVCFLFPGQGSQKINMFRDLMIAFPESREPFEAADELFPDFLEKPLSETIYPEPVFSPEEKKHRAALLNDTQTAQPALAAADLFALELLGRFNIHPDFSAGHSFGEYVALYAAGVIKRSDLIRLAAARGRISREASRENNGKMAAVQADIHTVEKLIEDAGSTAERANLNAPLQTVIGGPDSEIEKCLDLAKKRNIKAVRIPVTAAFHTSHMQKAADKLALEFEKIEFNPPKLPVYSNTTAQPYPEAGPAIKTLLSRHIREPLDFVSQIKNLYDAGASVFIEAGPGRVLNGLVDAILGEQHHKAVFMESAGLSGTRQLAHLLAELTAAGVAVDFSHWFAAPLLEKKDLEKLFKEAAVRAKPPSMTWRIKNGKIVSPDFEQPDDSTMKTDVAACPDGEKPSLPVEEGMKQKTSPGSFALNPLENSENKEYTVMDYKNNNNDHSPAASACEPMISRIQANLDHFIELQQGQQRLMERFLDMQHQLMALVLNGNGMSAGAIPVSYKGSLSRGSEKQAGVIGVPPAPVLPKLTPIKASGQRQSAFVHSPPSSPAFGPESSALLPAQSKEPASVVQFQADLLRIVSELTGYPENMLELDAHLEADLGIDSIKRVEIFSRLTEHHQLLESQSEDRVLEELADLKSLRKIIDWFDANRTRLLAEGDQPSKKS